jgi:hypothetical protein
VNVNRRQKSVRLPCHRSVCEFTLPRPSIVPKHRASGRRPAPTDLPSETSSAETAADTPAGRCAGRHRAADRRPRLSRRLALPGIAATVTGLVIGVGLVAGDQPDASANLTAELDSKVSTVDSDVLAGLEAERDRSVSRSADRRTAVDHRKVRLLSQRAESGGQVTRVKDLGSGDPRTVARSLLAEFGFSTDQFSCLDALWTKESGWNVHANNPTSSAYGIPQALPGEKMASAGADWATNPATQIRWGLGYIAARYGTPCGAWGHSQSYNWY